MVAAQTLAYVLGLTLPFLPTTSASWPFSQRKYVAESIADIGSLGLQDVGGRVAAMADWDGDQKLDLFTLSEDGKTVQIHLWDKDHYKFKASHTLDLPAPAYNIIPGDFNHDGRSDLLAMYESGDKGGWWGRGNEKIGMEVHLGGGPAGGFQEDKWTLTESTLSQPLVFDADGSLRPSLLGYVPGENNEMTAQTWYNDATGITMRKPLFTGADSICQLTNPHSSAFLDLDGDCSPDVILHCERPRTTGRFIQIWSNRGKDGYTLSRSYNLPKGSGPLTFADMDRDGTMDIVFPVCGRRTSSAGTGSDCAINIAYNKQIPICTGLNAEASNNGGDTSLGLKCRGWSELCTADPNYRFDFEEGNESLQSIPLSSLFPGQSPDILLHVPGSPHIPLAIRPGDYNVDGFPDLLLVVGNDTANTSHSVFGGKSTQARVLRNVACHKGVSGCSGKQDRGLQVETGHGWEALDRVTDVTGASWLDIDDDGSLDILLLRSGDQDKQKVTFMKNNFYHDAFFLKAQVLNGACDGPCEAVNESKAYSALGVSYSGATYKFTVLDTLGHRVAQQAAQLPQTGYHALGTPYSFIGLGRTNNYIERLTVGASLAANHITDLESLIPNSQVMINPPYPVVPDMPEQQQLVKNRPLEWRSELFLKPGDWVPWVAAAVFGAVIILAMAVFGLNEREKKEDEKERQRALHAINFQAL